MNTPRLTRLGLALALGASLLPAAAAPSAQATTHWGTAPHIDLRALHLLAKQTGLFGLLTDYLRLSRQSLAPESNAEPDHDRSVVPGLGIELPQAIQTVDQVLQRAPGSMGHALRAARRDYGLALERLQAGSRDASPLYLAEVLEHAARAQAAMGQALDIAAGMDPVAIGLLLPAVQKVREAARRSGSDMLDLAQSNGVDPARLLPALQALRTGDAQHDAGQYGVAVQQYAGAFGIAANTVVFNMDRFEQNLRSVFDAGSVGWSYALSQGGQLARAGSAGLARTGADQPLTVQNSAKKMHVASVSKTMTAIVILRLLADRGLNADSVIDPWLPTGWARGIGVAGMTFRQLMTHRSGFGQNAPTGSDYASLRSMVAQNVPFKGTFDYENANFGLLRVIGAKLLGVDPSLLPVDQGAMSAAAFLNYAQVRFNAVGVPFSCEPEAATPTLQYRFPDSGNPGYAEPSRSLSCGGFGVQASARELSRTMSFMRYTHNLLPAGSYQQMKAGHLGFMNPADGYDYAQGAFGNYYTHGGDWDHSGGAGNGGLDACVMVFPINVEAAVLINSSRKTLGVGYPNGGYQCKVVKWAFENAWVAN